MMADGAGAINASAEIALEFEDVWQQEKQDSDMNRRLGNVCDDAK